MLTDAFTYEIRRAQPRRRGKRPLPTGGTDRRLCRTAAMYVAGIACIVGAQQSVEDADVGARLWAPVELGRDPLPGGEAHRHAQLVVVEQPLDGVGERGDVAGRHVEAGVAGRDPGLDEVEGDRRQAVRHVLHRLVHRRHVVERRLEVGAQADVGGAEVLGDLVRSDATGEGDVVVEPELGRLRAQVLQAVAEAEQRRRARRCDRAGAPARPSRRGSVDAVLRAHDAEVDEEVIGVGTDGCRGG